MILFNFLKALLLTEVFEAMVAFILGYREKRFYTALILVNIITNPSINCAIMLLYNLKLYNTFTIPMLEIFVVISEWKLLNYALGKNKKSYLNTAIIINFCSYLFGVLLFKCY
jgi:hypothetical protein